MFGYLKIVEQRILEAQRRGDFDNLPGAGKPLDLDSDASVPEDLKLAYKMLKNSGCVPPEVELKKEIRQTEELLARMEDTQEKYRAMKKLNHLVLKLNTMSRRPAHMEVPEYYERKLVDRFGKNKECTAKAKKPFSPTG